MYRAAIKYGFDVALVTIRRPTFAAIELTRRSSVLSHLISSSLALSCLCAPGPCGSCSVARCPTAWDELEPSLKAQAERLADLAKRGLLVLFLGSGISAGAGMPVWTTLLNLLAKRSGMSLLCNVFRFCLIVCCIGILRYSSILRAHCRHGAQRSRGIKKGTRS